MGSGSSSALVLALTVVLTVPNPAGAAQEGAAPELSKLIKETLTHRWRWLAYWDGPDKLRGYLPGRQVRISTLRSGSEVLVCIPELGQVFEILVVEPARLDVIKLSLLEADPCQSEADRFRRRTFPLVNVEQRGRIMERAGLSAAEARTPAPPMPQLPPDRSFVQGEYTWVLPALSPPELPASISDTEAADIEETVRREALRRWRPECGDGEALVPRVSPRDPAVWVYVDLGGPCEKGVVDIIRDRENRLTLGRFTTGEFNLDRLLPRIRNILLRRIVIRR